MKTPAFKLLLACTLGCSAAPVSAPADASSDAAPSDVADSESDDAVTSPPLGLSAPGRIVRDPAGIPHVIGATTLDALRLQGFATARDRLYQMELLRRRAHGRRAEVLGEAFYNSDLQSRALRLTDWAVRTRDALATEDPELLATFHAYVDGVNEWRARAIAGDGGAALSAQLVALGVVPEPWTVVDCLTIEKLLTAGLSMRPDQDVILGLLDLLLGPALFADFYRYPPFDREYIVPNFAVAAPSNKPAVPPSVSGAPARMRAQLAAIPRSELTAAYHRLKALDWSHGGSNNQAIAGEHTESGAPILMGDSHQGVAHPAIYYFVHLRATDGSLDVVGASFPGVPFVVFGHNGVGAFTPTTSLYDSADAYLEVFDATAETVTFEGKAVPVEGRDEVIRVRAPGGTVADAEARTVRLHDVPHHGPMLPAAALGLPIPLDISIRWVGYQARSAGRSFWAMNTAKDFESFRAALEPLPSGGMHWTWADVSGTIGYSSRVDLPARAVVDKATPPTKLLPGEGGFEWSAPAKDSDRPFVPVPSSQIPWAKNPPSGFIATANNDPVGHTDDGDPFDANPYLSGVYDIGTRAYRPRLLFEALRAEKKLTLDDAALIQLDVVSRLGQRLAPFIANAASRRPDLVDARLAEGLAILGEWHYRCDVDSTGATLFHAWLATFTRRVLADEGKGLLESLILDDLDYKVGLVVTKFLTHWLETTDTDIDAIEAGTLAFPSSSGANFFDDASTEAQETRDETILLALSDAMVELEAIYQELAPDDDASDPTTWAWGRWHVIRLHDPVDGLVPRAGSAAVPKPGGLYTTDVGDYDWLEGGALPTVLEVTNAPSNRFLFELLPTGIVGRIILPGGQSQHPGSPFHNDQLEAFARGEYLPLAFAQSDIDATAVDDETWPAGFGAPR